MNLLSTWKIELDEIEIFKRSEARHRELSIILRNTPQIEQITTELPYDGVVEANRIREWLSPLEPNEINRAEQESNTEYDENESRCRTRAGNRERIE